MGDTNVSFKKVSNFRRNKGAMRAQKRESEGERSSSEGEEAKVVQNFRKRRKNPMVQSSSTGGILKRNRKNAQSSSSDSEVEERKEMISGVQFESGGVSQQGPSDMGATATLEIETEHDKDSQAAYSRNLETIKDMKGKADDKVYRGMGAYGQFFEKKDTAAGNAASGFVRKGPIRAPTNIRQSVRWDYQPDLCKDFKETGFCGFGDSCKFLHDRTDYKHGWEIERDWEAGRYGKDDDDPGKYEISDDDDDLPFKCFICRESFTDPIVTRCRHYFCEKCALANYKKTQKCYICEKNTGGIFNPAKELIEKLKAEGGSKKKKNSDESDLDDDEEEKETPMEKLPDPEPSGGSGSENSDKEEGEKTDTE